VALRAKGIKNQVASTIAGLQAAIGTGPHWNIVIPSVVMAPGIVGWRFSVRLDEVPWRSTLARKRPLGPSVSLGTFVRGIALLWDSLQILEGKSAGRSNRTCKLGEWSVGREET